MTQKTYSLLITFEQILNLVLQLPAEEQEEIIQQIKKNSPKEQTMKLSDLYGCIQDEIFIRHPQLEQPEREAF
ncbi:hypothetical protein H5968_02195 [Sphaerospermopsis sp. LEGE 00249]|jgi:hypothetical protein|uniref:hypothetical protein n=1 Tax=Sphaerospermopsis sp. LEGE 00249 TaxID=1380707 RepID=UPI00164E203F|nr:hypothetical protein [Sphaerospermopsis sp. LEGE 00249]MBC5793985.1 hypothetical protein [Sphaerospermopsis sp. LEGE 00249]